MDRFAAAWAMLPYGLILAAAVILALWVIAVFSPRQPGSERGIWAICITLLFGATIGVVVMWIIANYRYV